MIKQKRGQAITAIIVIVCLLLLAVVSFVIYNILTGHSLGLADVVRRWISFGRS
jgi:hypothetical protein